MSEKTSEIKAGLSETDHSPVRATARERIFETASDLFYRKGIHAVGVETIAEEAHSTKMSLYRNFSSKDELVAECLRQHDAKFWQYWDGMLAQHPQDPRRQLSALFARAVSHFTDPESRGCPLANAAVEITDPHHPGRKVIEEHKAKLRARLADICAGADVDDPALLADELFLLLEGALAAKQTLGPSGPGKSLARAAETLIDAHLGKHAAGR